ncbi:hypothetical protein UlMin_013890 [Ulmus minor]
MHWIRQHTRGQTSYAALKLDMNKAYDRVEWSFLQGMLMNLGFASQWVDLIMRCISSVSYSFLINGEVQGSLKPSKGIRQGDPLSPYLFVICAHGLLELLINSEKRKLFRGVRISPSAHSISHLFFADDNLIFYRAKTSECEKIRQCLMCYSEASGQLINYKKSALTFSPNAARSVVGDICTLFGISLVDGHNLYLGLPTFSMRNKIIQFGYIRDRVVKNF